MTQDISNNVNSAEAISAQSLQLTSDPQSLTVPSLASKALIQIVTAEGLAGTSPTTPVALLSEMPTADFGAITSSTAAYLFDFSFYEVRAVKNLGNVKLKKIGTATVYAKIQYFK